MQVCRGRNQVRRKRHRFAAFTNGHPLHASGVPVRRMHRHTWKHFLDSLHQLESARLQRTHVFGKVARAFAGARRPGTLPVLALQVDAGRRRVQARFSNSIDVLPFRFFPNADASSMVEVQVRENNIGELVPAKRQVALWNGAHGKVFGFFGPKLVADTGINQHARRLSPKYENTRHHTDAIVLVSRVVTLPQRLRHRAEHRAPIQAETGQERGCNFVTGYARQGKVATPQTFKVMNIFSRS